jgi:hypothetical protein
MQKSLVHNGEDETRVGLPPHRTKNKIPLLHRDADRTTTMGMQDMGSMKRPGKKIKLFST